MYIQNLAKFAVISLALTICSSVSHALTYDISRTIGGGTVTGFIETDGTLGTLSVASITNWVLTLTSPNLSGGSPAVIAFQQGFTGINGMTGSPVSATATDLLYDFSEVNSWFFLQGGVQYVPFWGLGTIDSCGGSIPCTGEYIGWNTDASIGAAEAIPHSGVVSFASISNVPIPATSWLLGSALLWLAGLAKRRNLGVKSTHYA